MPPQLLRSSRTSMDNYAIRFSGAVIISMVMAFAITMIPLPEVLEKWRPEWVALTLVHWALMVPRKTGILLAWCSGLFLDALYGSSLGQHALGLTFVVFISLRMRPRISLTTLSHQLTVLLFALGTYLLINLWVLGFTGNSPSAWVYWLSLVGSLLVWPIYHWLLTLLFMMPTRFNDM